jgi:Holliday junction DNA helicase RuvA
LKDKVDGELVSVDNLSSSGNTIKNEALTALVVLGIDKKRAEKIVGDAIKKGGDDLTVEDLVKLTLKSL